MNLLSGANSINMSQSALQIPQNRSRSTTKGGKLPRHLDTKNHPAFMAKNLKEQRMAFKSKFRLPQISKPGVEYGANLFTEEPMMRSDIHADINQSDASFNIGNARGWNTQADRALG